MVKLPILHEDHTAGCDKCAASCCTHYSLVSISDVEAERLKLEYPTSVQHLFGVNALTKKRDGSCFFLEHGRCRIQHDKPSVCLSFVENSDRCRRIYIHRESGGAIAGSLWAMLSQYPDEMFDDCDETMYDRILAVE